MLTMSPSASRRESGMPWQMTSLTELHRDFGIAAVVERGGVGAGGDHRLVADPVEFVGGDARRHVAADLDEGLGGDPAGRAHGLDLRRGAHRPAGAFGWLARGRVVGPPDVRQAPCAQG